MTDIPYPQLRIGNSREPPLQASKWLQLQLLVDEVEMQSLFHSLTPFHIFTTSIVCKRNEGFVSHADFLIRYAEYIETLRNGILPDENAYRQLFSSVFTVTADHLFQIEIPEDRHIIRVARPVLQLQLNKVSYSPLDEKFRSMVLGRGGILWGLQFSYPQLFRDPVSGEIFKAHSHSHFPNGVLYKELQRWMRLATMPTPFKVGGKCVNVPMRLGKNCFSWINRHPQLLEQGVEVVTKE